MDQINYEVLGALLGVLSYPQDHLLDERLCNTDGNDEKEVREVIKDLISPYFKSFNAASQKVIERTLRYALTDDNAPLEEIFYGKQISFDLPEGDYKLLYLWIWDELFSYKFTPLEIDRYQLTDDMNVVYQLKRVGN